jgi:hypothetical protein
LVLALREEFPDGRWDHLNSLATFDFLAAYSFSLSSTVVSLLCFLIWVFVRPTRRKLPRSLTKNVRLILSAFYWLPLLTVYPPHPPPPPAAPSTKNMNINSVGSYFHLQLLVNILCTGLNFYSCTASVQPWRVMYLGSNLAAYSLSMITTNLLCHRYLHAKAEFLMKATYVSASQLILLFCVPSRVFLLELVDLIVRLYTLISNRQNVHLERLQRSFKWEIRSLYLIPVCLGVYVLSAPAGTACFALTVVAIVIMDLAFSIEITLIFIRPVYLILRQSGARGSPLRTTMCMTLFGSTLAVFSSTAFYILCILRTTIVGRFAKSIWLEPLMFALNLDSILNDVGMIFVCGVLKNLTWENVRATTWNVSHPRQSARHSKAPSVSVSDSDGDRYRTLAKS